MNRRKFLQIAGVGAIHKLALPNFEFCASNSRVNDPFWGADERIEAVRFGPFWRMDYRSVWPAGVSLHLQPGN